MPPDTRQRAPHGPAANIIAGPLSADKDQSNRPSLFDPPDVRLGDPDTCRAAADMAREWRSKLKRHVYSILLERGPHGATDDEVHQLLPDELLGAIAKRRGSLVGEGLVVDSGRRRPTRRGCPAVAWVAIDALEAP